MKSVSRNWGATIVLVLQLLQSGSCVQLYNRHPSYLEQVQYQSAIPGVLNNHQSTLQYPRFYQQPAFLQNVQESLPSENQLLYFGFPPNYANLPLVHAENPNIADSFYTPMPPFSIPEELLIQSQMQHLHQQTTEPPPRYDPKFQMMEPFHYSSQMLNQMKNLHQQTTEPPPRHDPKFQMMEPFHYSTPNEYRTIIPVYYNQQSSNNKKPEDKHKNGMQQQYLKEIVKQNEEHPRYHEQKPMNYRNQKPYNNNGYKHYKNQNQKPIYYQNVESTNKHPEIATKQQLYSSNRHKPINSRNPVAMQHHSMLMNPAIITKMRNPSMKMRNPQKKQNTRLNMDVFKPPSIYPNTKGGFMDSQDKPIAMQETGPIKMPPPYQQNKMRKKNPVYGDFGEPMKKQTKERIVVKPVKEEQESEVEDSDNSEQGDEEYEDDAEETDEASEEPRSKVEHTFVKTDKNANYKWGVRLQLN